MEGSSTYLGLFIYYVILFWPLLDPPSLSYCVIISLTIDKRIKHLFAQTCMQKLMLNSHIKELVRQANRHKDYVNDGEDAEMLVDRAVQLKINVQKKEQIEESLVTNFSNLTMLLELLNMEGDNTQGVKLSNKVTVVIEKYRGKIETFQHKDRSTLKFAITKRQDNSSKSSKNSSRNNSIDRRYSRIHDHLKPNKVGWEDSLEIVLKLHGYVIISCNSTTFRRAQCHYSPFEAELLAITWMCEK